MKDRVVYISTAQNVAALIDNVYGELTASEARGLMATIDDAFRAEVGIRAVKFAAIGYLRGLGIVVNVTEVAS